jgi:hypothetical protein
MARSCTVEQIPGPVRGVRQKITRGKEQAKVRLVIDRGETPEEQP